MKQIHSFGVVSFKTSTPVQECVRALHQWSLENETEVTFHPLLADILPEGAVAAQSEDELLDRTEALVSVGGDGTFLSAAHMCIADPRPIVGINLGGLGFLTGIGPDDITEQLCKLCHGEYQTISREFLKAELMRDGTCCQTLRALNDVFVNRMDMPKLASISVHIGDEFVNDFEADGIIIATPAGSTAYSLAAGGPIVMPDAKTLLLTPICPHSLNERPVVVPDTRAVRLTINERNPELLLSADGLNAVRLRPGDEVVVQYDRNHASLIQLSESSFFMSLRSKLDWGRGPANRRRRADDT